MVWILPVRWWVCRALSLLLSIRDVAVDIGIVEAPWPVTFSRMEGRFATELWEAAAESI